MRLPLKIPALAATAAGSCFLFNMIARGTLETYTVFLLPLADEFGWSRASLAGVYSLGILSGGLFAPLAGLLFDRWGPRRLYALGAAAFVAALLVASVGSERWHFYAGFAVPIGFAVAALGNVPHAALLSRWFDRNLSAVTGFVFSALGVGPMLLLPLSQGLIHGFGWRGAYQWLAGLLGLALLAALVLAPWKRLAAGDPERAAGRPFAAASEDLRGWTLRDALRSVPFWGLCWTYFFTAVGLYAAVVQMVAYLVHSGYSPIAAATAYGMTGMLTPVGMIGGGWLADRFSRRGVVTMTYVITLSGIAVLFVIGHNPAPWLLLPFILCFGLTLGSRGPLVATITTGLFRGPRVGAILGGVTLSGGLGGATGSWASGFIYDLAGGYTPVLIFSFVLTALGSLPFWAVPALGKR